MSLCNIAALSIAMAVLSLFKPIDTSTHWPNLTDHLFDPAPTSSRFINDTILKPSLWPTATATHSFPPKPHFLSHPHTPILAENNHKIHKLTMFSPPIFTSLTPTRSHPLSHLSTPASATISLLLIASSATFLLLLVYPFLRPRSDDPSPSLLGFMDTIQDRRTSLDRAIDLATANMDAQIEDIFAQIAVEKHRMRTELPISLNHEANLLREEFEMQARAVLERQIGRWEQFIDGMKPPVTSGAEGVRRNDEQGSRAQDGGEGEGESADMGQEGQEAWSSCADRWTRDSMEFFRAGKALFDGMGASLNQLEEHIKDLKVKGAKQEQRSNGAWDRIRPVGADHLHPESVVTSEWEQSDDEPVEDVPIGSSVPQKEHAAILAQWAEASRCPQTVNEFEKGREIRRQWIENRQHAMNGSAL